MIIPVRAAIFVLRDPASSKGDKTRALNAILKHPPVAEMLSAFQESFAKSENWGGPNSAEVLEEAVSELFFLICMGERTPTVQEIERMAPRRLSRRVKEHSFRVQWGFFIASTR